MNFPRTPALPSRRQIPAHGVIRALIVALMLFGATAQAADITTSFSSRKSGEFPEKTGETEFTCSDTIFALIETRGLDSRVHDVEIHWFGPRGDRQELTRFSAHTANESTMIWGWMRLHPPEDSGIIRTFDPSHGMRNFIGEWTVKVYIDGRQRSTGHFDVLC